MSRSTQVSGYVFRDAGEDTGIEFLALRRSEERGGFWQGVTGGVEAADADLEAAMRREVFEELGLRALQIVQSDGSYEFIGDEGSLLTEHTFGVEVDPMTEPRLSDEHEVYLWVPERTLDDLIPRAWTENRFALHSLSVQLHAENGRKSVEHGFSSQDWSLLMLKPDARAKGLEDEVLAGLENSGLRIASARREIVLDDAMIERLWIPPTEWDENPMDELDDWWYELVKYMKSDAVDAFLLVGPNATEEALKIKRLVRAKHDSNFLDDESRPVSERVRSLVHCSDSDRELVRNALVFWNDVELRDLVNQTKPVQK